MFTGCGAGGYDIAGCAGGTDDDVGWGTAAGGILYDGAAGAG